MSDEFKEMEEFDDDDMEVVTMIDDETGEEVEFVVIDRREMNGMEYILVIDSKDIDCDEADASVLKAVSESDDEITYSVIDDAEEFAAAAKLFDGEDYEVEY